MKISELSVRRPVLASMVIAVILLFGSVSYSQLSLDLFPQLTFPVAAVSTTYEEAGPQEIEALISAPLENVMGTIPGVKRITSQSRTGSSLLIVEFDWGTDMNFATLQMREKVDLIRENLPEGLPTPVVLKFDPNVLPIMQIGLISKEQNLEELYRFAQNALRNPLERVEGVASLSISGGRQKEVQIELSEERLRSLGLTYTQLSQLLATENVNLPVGLATEANRILPVRQLGQFTSLEELRNLPLVTPTGARFKLSDVAEIRETLATSFQEIRTNGESSLMLVIQKQSGANTVDVSRAVRATLEGLQEELPKGVEIVPLFDQAEYIELSIRTVNTNMLTGAFLAAAILYLFLKNVRATLLIGVSIPISVITTFTLFYFTDQTLNLLTLGGLALGIGMMVDSSIVILENIYRYRQQGASLIRAAIDGTSEVGLAVTASVLTTVSVFLPAFFVEGLAAQLLRPLAMSVSFSLLASLFTSLIIMPLFASKLLGRAKHSRIFKSEGAWMGRLNGAYHRWLKTSLAHRWKTVGITLGLFGASLALIPLIGTEFLPKQDQSFISIEVRMPYGTVLADTRQVVELIEKQANELPEVTTSFSTVGRTGFFGLDSGVNTHRAFIGVRLSPKNERERSSEQIGEQLRAYTQKIPGASIVIDATGDAFGGSSAPISLSLRGDDFGTLRELARQVELVVKSVPGTREVKSDDEQGQPEFRIVVDRDRAATYGLNSVAVATSIRTLLQGENAGQLRRNGEELAIRFVSQPESLLAVDALLDFQIGTPLGTLVPLREVASLELDQSPNVIKRVDRLRDITVEGKVVGRDLGSVVDDIRAEIDRKINLPPGYSIDFTGQKEQMDDAFFKLTLALVMAILLVYMIMAAQFESLFYPFIVMFSLPMTVTGVMLGLLITGKALGVGAMIGLLILAGIVVNNGIVLVDYTNTLRKQGSSTYEALLQAGPVRLRPILMTTMTTILGLIPLMLSQGDGSEIQSPMAIVIIFGLLASTVVTLVFVPVMYSLLDQAAERLKHSLAHRFGEEGKVE